MNVRGLRAATTSLTELGRNADQTVSYDSLTEMWAAIRKEVTNPWTGVQWHKDKEEGTCGFQHQWKVTRVRRGVIVYDCSCKARMVMRP